MEQAPFVVGQRIFTENIVKDIGDHKPLLSKLCAKNTKGQKYLLHAVEAFIGGDDKDMRSKLLNKKNMSKILLKLYDEDIVEEETFYAWHEKASKRYTDKTTAKTIREMSNEFIEWLKTAEESSDEDEEDSDDDRPEPQVRKAEGERMGEDVCV